MASKIKSFISEKYAKKFEELTILVKEKSVEMMTGNESKSQNSSTSPSMKALVPSYLSKKDNDDLEFDIDEKVIEVKEKEYKIVVEKIAEVQK